MREIVWIGVHGVSVDHCRVDARSAEGLVIAVQDKPIRARYLIEWDEAWRVRRVRVELEGDRGVDLVSDGKGSWRTAEGEEIKGLSGCVDVDLSITPFTNTLPVRRLALRPLESADLQVAYVDVASLRVGVAKQRYTCLVRRDDGTMHRYESGTFSADVVFDGDGLVVEYPHVWTRVWPER